MQTDWGPARHDKATALIAANSLIALFLFSVSAENVELATPLVAKMGSGPSIFTTLFIGLFAYAFIITAFRSIYTLYKAMVNEDDDQFDNGYYLFFAVISGSILLICGIAFSLYLKVLGRTAIPLQLLSRSVEPLCDITLMIGFLAYGVIVILWPSPIISAVKKAESFLALDNDSSLDYYEFS
jgi:hypothetical protein